MDCKLFYIQAVLFLNLFLVMENMILGPDGSAKNLDPDYVALHSQ